MMTNHEQPRKKKQHDLGCDQWRQPPGFDAATVERAQAANARLREDYPDGFALDANHVPHITCSSSLCERWTSTRSRMLWPKCCV